MEEFTNDTDENVAPNQPVTAEEPLPERMTSIFVIDTHSYDVVLDDEKISWASLTGKNKCPKIKRSRSKNLIRRLSFGSKESLSGENENNDCIYLRDVLGVRIKRLRRAHHGEGEGVCQGIALIYADRKEHVRLKSRMMVLGNPSENICVPWILKIKKVIETFTSRPRTLHIFMQPHAGGGRGKAVYKEKIRPLLDFIGVKAEVTELLHNEHVKQEMVHLELDHYDSIVCIGGDGTVNQLLNGLLHRTLHYKGVKVTPGTTPPQPPLPMGIIPAGTFNTIAHSIMGTEDPITAVVHIILGHTCPVNVCSMWEDEKLVQWGFNCHYGFYGNLLKSSKKYKGLGEKRIELAAMKILSGKKFRPFTCDVHFAPATDAGKPTDGVVCKEGCDVCDVNNRSERRRSTTFSDNIENLDSPNESNTSGQAASKHDASNAVPWENRNYGCLGVSIHSLAQRSTLAPYGMSKHTHNNDGALDLVLIKYADKKEFARYLRRLGNHKNAFEFQFVESHRCKEIKIRMKLENHSNSVQQDTTKQGERKKSGSDERKKSGSEERKKSIRKSQQMEVVDILAESEEEEETEEDAEEKGAYVNESLKPDDSFSSGLNKKLSNVRRSWCSDDGSLENGVGEDHNDGIPNFVTTGAAKPTTTTTPAAPVTDDKHMQSVWNVDNELIKQLDLDFRIHPSLVKIHGLGVPESSDPDIVKMSCLSIY